MVWIWHIHMNRSTFDKVMRKKRFLHFRSHWVTLTFRLQIFSLVTLVRGDVSTKLEVFMAFLFRENRTNGTDNLITFSCCFFVWSVWRLLHLGHLKHWLIDWLTYWLDGRTDGVQRLMLPPSEGRIIRTGRRGTRYWEWYWWRWYYSQVCSLLWLMMAIGVLHYNRYRQLTCLYSYWYKRSVNSCCMVAATEELQFLRNLWWKLSTISLRNFSTLWQILSALILT